MENKRVKQIMVGASILIVLFMGNETFWEEKNRKSGRRLLENKDRVTIAAKADAKTLDP